jgi:RNA polymerase sigma-70 factor (ECF subfamily)
VPLVLFHFEEVSYRDIAETLGVSVGKVKTDIHRGREALRRLLPDYASR